MPAEPPRRRRLVALRSPRRAALLLAAAALVQAGVGYSLAASSPSTPDLTLASDADGVALVNATQLAPGRAVVRCLRLSYANAVAGDRLGLVSSASGALADHLDVRVEAGTGGSAASCTGFSGAVVYTGTLSALSATHGTATSALPLRTLPDGSAAVTVRLSFRVQNSDTLQGQVASSDLLWVADAIGDRTPPPPVVTPVDPTPIPTAPPPPVVTVPPAPPVVTVPPVVVPTVPTVPPVDTPTAPAAPADPGTGSNTGTGSSTGSSTGTGTASPAPVTPDSVVSPAPSAAPGSGTSTAPPSTRPDAPGATGGSPPGSGGDGGGGGPVASVGHVFSSGARAVSSGAKAVAGVAGDLAHAVGKQVIAPVAAAAAPAAKGAGIGLGGTAPLLGMFLLIQGRIDRKDPKLALAPAYADPDLTFNDIPRGPLNPRATASPTGTTPSDPSPDDPDGAGA